jgi:hypothetical protein
LLDSTKSDPGTDDHNLGKGFIWKDFENEFNFSSLRPGSSTELIELTDDSDINDDLCDMPTRSGSTFTSGTHNSQGNKEEEGSRSLQPSSNISPTKNRKFKEISLGSMVKDEIEYRKKEAWGLAPGKNSSRKLGQAPKPGPLRNGASCDSMKNLSKATKPSSSNLGKWRCLVCTL